MKIPDKRELQQTEINHSSDIYFKYFTKIYKEYTAKPYSFDTTVIVTVAVIDTPLPYLLVKNK